jgi:hypothetical protein
MSLECIPEVTGLILFDLYDLQNFTFGPFFGELLCVTG